MTSSAPEEVLASSVAATLSGLRTDLVQLGSLLADPGRAAGSHCPRSNRDALVELVELIDSALELVAGVGVAGLVPVASVGAGAG